MSILRPKSISFSAAQSGVSTSLQEKKATLQEFKEKSPNKNRPRAVSLFLRISEGSAGTRERRSDQTRQTRAAAREEKSASPVTRVVISCLARFTRQTKEKERLFSVYTWMKSDIWEGWVFERKTRITGKRSIGEWNSNQEISWLKPYIASSSKYWEPGPQWLEQESS